ncbi:hypothetical protein HK102_008480 [Quaeritorhiza haematococci]|nr:hypothetical protein HK102_008480 [Quaeritorhiza haematococci]
MPRDDGHSEGASKSSINYLLSNAMKAETDDSEAGEGWETDDSAAMSETDSVRNAVLLLDDDHPHHSASVSGTNDYEDELEDDFDASGDEVDEDGWVDDESEVDDDNGSGPALEIPPFGPDDFLARGGTWFNFQRRPRPRPVNPTSGRTTRRRLHPPNEHSVMDINIEGDVITGSARERSFIGRGRGRGSFALDRTYNDAPVGRRVVTGSTVSGLGRRVVTGSTVPGIGMASWRNRNDTAILDHLSSEGAFTDSVGSGNTEDAAEHAGSTDPSEGIFHPMVTSGWPLYVFAEESNKYEQSQQKQYDAQMYLNEDFYPKDWNEDWSYSWGNESGSNNGAKTKAGTEKVSESGSSSTSSSLRPPSVFDTFNMSDLLDMDVDDEDFMMDRAEMLVQLQKVPETLGLLNPSSKAQFVRTGPGLPLQFANSSSTANHFQCACSMALGPEEEMIVDHPTPGSVDGSDGQQRQRRPVWMQRPYTIYQDGLVRAGRNRTADADLEARLERMGQRRRRLIPLRTVAGRGRGRMGRETERAGTDGSTSATSGSSSSSAKSQSSQSDATRGATAPTRNPNFKVDVPDVFSFTRYMPEYEYFTIENASLVLPFRPLCIDMQYGYAAIGGEEESLGIYCMKCPRPHEIHFEESGSEWLANTDMYNSVRITRREIRRPSKPLATKSFASRGSHGHESEEEADVERGNSGDDTSFEYTVLVACNSGKVEVFRMWPEDPGSTIPGNVGISSSTAGPSNINAVGGLSSSVPPVATASPRSQKREHIDVWQRTTIKGFDRPVNVAQLSPDGLWLAAVGDKGAVWCSRVRYHHPVLNRPKKAGRGPKGSEPMEIVGGHTAKEDDGEWEEIDDVGVNDDDNNEDDDDVEEILVEELDTSAPIRTFDPVRRLSAESLFEDYQGPVPSRERQGPTWVAGENMGDSSSREWKPFRMNKLSMQYMSWNCDSRFFAASCDSHPVVLVFEVERPKLKDEEERSCGAKPKLRIDTGAPTYAIAFHPTRPTLLAFTCRQAFVQIVDIAPCLSSNSSPPLRQIITVSYCIPPSPHDLKERLSNSIPGRVLSMLAYLREHFDFEEPEQQGDLTGSVSGTAVDTLLAKGATGRARAAETQVPDTAATGNQNQQEHRGRGTNAPSNSNFSSRSRKVLEELPPCQKIWQKLNGLTWSADGWSLYVASKRRVLVYPVCGVPSLVELARRAVVKSQRQRERERGQALAEAAAAVATAATDSATRKISTPGSSQSQNTYTTWPPSLLGSSTSIGPGFRQKEGVRVEAHERSEALSDKDYDDEIAARLVDPWLRSQPWYKHW